jgi:hypothetical protein
MPQTGILPKPSGARKQLPVLQLIAQHGVGDVVGGEGEAADLDEQRVAGQIGGGGKRCFDEFAARKIVARHGEVDGRFHLRDPGIFPAGIFAGADVGFATARLFKTLFAASARDVCAWRAR